MALVPERQVSRVRSGSVDRLKQCAKQLGRLLHRLRRLGLEYRESPAERGLNQYRRNPA